MKENFIKNEASIYTMISFFAAGLSIGSSIELIDNICFSIQVFLLIRFLFMFRNIKKELDEKSKQLLKDIQKFENMLKELKEYKNN